MVYQVIFVVFLAFICFFAYTCIKYRNPYKLFMVFGGKGSGKTTLMIKLALNYQKKGFLVYSDREVPGGHLFDIKDFGRCSFPPNSVVLIDEVGLIWDNRHYKDFKDEVKVYFKYQRQYRNIVYLFSQSFDVDKKIRDLTDHLYVVQNWFNCFSLARRVTKRITVVHADKSVSGESKIVDDYSLDPIWTFPFGGLRVTYIPKYVRYFKSFDPPELPPYAFEQLPAVDLSWRRWLKLNRLEMRGALSKFNRKKK